MKRTKVLEQVQKMHREFEAARIALNGEKPVFGTLTPAFADALVMEIRAGRDFEHLNFDRSSVQELEIVFPKDLPQP